MGTILADREWIEEVANAAENPDGDDVVVVDGTDAATTRNNLLEAYSVRDVSTITGKRYNLVNGIPVLAFRKLLVLIMLLCEG